MSTPTVRLACRIRDAVNAAADGGVNRLVRLQDIETMLRLTDADSSRSAVLHAANEGWLRTNDGAEVHSLAITFEGRNRARSNTRKGRLYR